MASVIERVVRGGAGFFAANLVTKGFGFAFVVIAGRLMGPTEFGILALALSVFGVVRQLATFGLPNTIQRFFSGGGEEDIEQFYAATLVIGGVATLVATLCLYFYAHDLANSVFREPELTSLLQVLAFSIGAAVAFEILRSLLQAQELIAGILWVDLVRSSGKVIALVLFVTLTTATATAGAWAAAVAFGIATMTAVWKAQDLSIRPSFEDFRPHLRRVLGYSAPLLLVGFSYFVAQQADRLMLGWLGDSEGVGLYTATSTLAMALVTLKASLVSIFKPIAASAYRKGDQNQIQEIFSFISRWVGAANGIALVAIGGGGTWMLGIFGAEYATDAMHNVLIVLACLYFLGAWAGPTGALLVVTDGHRIELYNTILFVVSNISLNIFLIEEYGVIGAAYATLLSGAFKNAIQLTEINYSYKFTPIRKDQIVILLTTAAGLGLVLVAPTNVLKGGVLLTYTSALGYYMFETSTESEKSFATRAMGRLAKR